jgi:hypothetical protein
VAVNTPYYAVSDRLGNISISAVPPGRYELHVWSELASPDALQGLNREVTVSDNASSLGTIRLVEEVAARAHKNKYGRDYDPPTSGNPAYSH